MVAANLVSRAPAPLPFYLARATGTHQPDGLGALDQGALRESDSAFGLSRKINPNTTRSVLINPVALLLEPPEVDLPPIHRVAFVVLSCGIPTHSLLEEPSDAALRFVLDMGGRPVVRLLFKLVAF